MEVHPPHEPIHTWRDFWIHLGTITVGLLIAIGLEQTVEYLHRKDEKAVLQQELRAEGEHDQQELHQDYRRIAILKKSLVAWHKQIDDAIATKGKLDKQYQPPDIGTIALPSEAMWDSAKASGRVGLLSDEQTAAYSFLYLQEDWLKDQARAWMTSSMNKLEFERRFENSFQTSGQDGPVDYSRMTVPDLKEYSALLNHEIATIDRMTDTLRYFDAVDGAVLRGARSEQEILSQVDAQLNP